MDRYMALHGWVHMDATKSAELHIHDKLAFQLKNVTKQEIENF